MAFFIVFFNIFVANIKIYSYKLFISLLRNFFVLMYMTRESIFLQKNIVIKRRTAGTRPAQQGQTHGGTLT